MTRLEEIRARMQQPKVWTGLVTMVLDADLEALLAVADAMQAEMRDRCCPLCDEGYVHLPDCPMAALEGGEG